MLIIILAGINIIFLISWLLHSWQQNLADSRNQLTFFHSLKKDNLVGRTVKIEIFNACGAPNVARELTDYLRERKVDVVFYDNFLVNNKIHKISHTLVIDRKDRNKANAKYVAGLIGVKKQYVIHQISPEREGEVAATILIGSDYLQLSPFR